MKNLNKTGLSLSQAQTISNLCNQRCNDINNIITSINNISKKIEYNGKDLTETIGKPIPTDIVELLLEKGNLHACQAFLMENIKAKDSLLNSIKNESFETVLERPKKPELLDCEELDMVTEEWGVEQLTADEYNEYIQAEALASHIGQFIHKNSKLDNLRKEITNIKQLEWFEIKKDEKVPVIISVHHTQEELLALHNKLAQIHKKHEQRVNYYKAKIKNLTNDENARRSKENSLMLKNIEDKNRNLMDEYTEKLRIFNAELAIQREKFEEEKYNKSKEVSAFRISIDPRFQPVIDQFIKDVE